MDTRIKYWYAEENKWCLSGLMTYAQAVEFLHLYEKGEIIRGCS